MLTNLPFIRFFTSLSVHSDSTNNIGKDLNLEDDPELDKLITPGHQHT